MNISRTTIVLYRSEPDPHVIRLRRLDTISDFFSDARVSLATSVTLRAGVTFHVNGIVSIGATGTRLNTVSKLLAAPTVSIGSSVFLPLTNPLRAAPTMHLETAAPLTIYPLLRAAPTLRLSLPPPRLTLGGVPLRAQPVVNVATNLPKLSRVAQVFTAQPTLHVQTNANLQVVGKTATDILITYNGAETSNVRLNSLVIDDVLNEAPNTCSFIVDHRGSDQPGAPPIGTEIKIGLRDLTAPNLLFAGTVTSVEPYYELAPNHPAWAIRCDDYTFLINRRKVFGTWRNVSATQVALEILSRFTANFSTAGIAAGLPAVTVTFRGETVMDALTQIANLIGGYAGGPDYNRNVWLFITDPRPAPDAVTANHPLLMMTPAPRQILDLSQVRTRVAVQGAGVAVGGPSDFNIDNRYNQLPLADSHVFTPGQGGQVITDDAQILTYTDVSPGQQASIVKGNVPPPAGAPLASLATGVAGGLQGSYLWKVAFANANGETPVGPATAPPLVCEAFPTPATTLGVGLSSAALGPLVGSYAYAVTFVTTRGETVPGVRATRTAVATPAPPELRVQDNAHAGRLAVGATYGYQVAYTTTYGETLPFGPVFYTPPALPGASISSVSQLDFGGLQGNADYTYGISLVTAVGESYPPLTFTMHTASGAGTPGNPVILNADFNGRIGPGNYAWACSYYADAFGESVLGPQVTGTVGTAPPGTSGARVLLGLSGLSARADGLRLYRGFQGGNPFQLAFDMRRGSTVASVWDVLSQGECGNPWPNHQLRGGGIAVQFLVGASPAPDVVARRLYRSKANSSELYLLAEIQNNADVPYLDAAADAALLARGPVAQTTGRQSVITIPGVPYIPAPSGYVGRRIYRTKANGNVYYRIADLKEMTTTFVTDNTPDESLTAEGPSNPSTARGESHFLQNLPVGPVGTLARRIYRTVGNGTELRLLVQINDNTTTTFTDAVPDEQLNNDLAPLVNSAGAAAVLLQVVPVGPPTVTQRFIYRTKAIQFDGQGSNEFFYAGTINNNVDTTFIDDKADKDLGRPPVATSTIGALAGDTKLVIQSAAGWPQSGWFEADSQVIRYDGISFGPVTFPPLGDTLQNIPPLLTITSLTRVGQTATAQTASAHGFTVGQRVVVLGADQPEYTGTRTITSVGGSTFTYIVNGTPATPATFPAGQKIVTSAPGAITGAIAGGTTVLSVPMLTGVSGITTPIQSGNTINLWVVRNSPSGQSALAGLEGGDGIHEYVVLDSELASVAACAARGDAELVQFQSYGVTTTYTTRDQKSRSGALVSINLPSPAITGTFRIQRVRIDQIDIANRLFPRYTVTCSTTKYSLTDLLRHVVLNHDHAA